ncbi:hypothetical protein ACP275_12G133500 [Erythranthe tilingii]
MKVLDSPFESLAASYLSYGVFTAVNNILRAWIAVFTASVSWWRISRALSSSPSPVPLLSRPEQRGAAALTSPPPPPPPRPELAAVEVAEPTTSCECSPKGKYFSMYNNYDNEYDDVIRGSGGEQGGEEDVDGGCKINGGASAVVIEKLGRRVDDWERVMVVVKMGDMGWYRCQDFDVLDGSVVRLWDDDDRRGEEERLRRRHTGGGLRRHVVGVENVGGVWL